MIAIVEAARAGLLRREHWGRNLVAGAIVGVVALPLSMAFAIASGVRPEQGLYTAIIAGIAVSQLAEESFEHMLHRADTALYRAKDNGRDRVCTELQAVA